MIPQEAIEEFKRICKVHYNRDLSNEEAHEAASRVLKFLQATQVPANPELFQKQS
jgi:uncharacterized protein YgfB (UPF0149 family)